MKTIKVTVNTTSHDCECCGFFNVSDLIIEVDGRKYEQVYDGHFGGGYWNGNEDTKLTFILGALFDIQYFNIDAEDWSNTIGEYSDKALTVNIFTRNLVVEYAGTSYVSEYTEQELEEIKECEYVTEDVISASLLRIINSLGYEIEEESTYEQYW
jgi:hypothetical protein